MSLLDVLTTGHGRMIDDWGTSVLHVDAGTGARLGHSQQRDPLLTADEVVVPDVPDDAWSDLLAAGFTIGPRWVTWGRRPEATQEAFLGSLSRRERYNLVRASRNGQDLPMWTEPLDQEHVARFLLLYDKQLSRLDHALPVAHVLADPERDLSHFVVIGAGPQTAPECMVIALVDGRTDSLRIAFSASTPRARDMMLSRALYLQAFEHARRLGLAWISLGTDPGRFGRLVSTGLFDFKASLGFVPVPLHHLDPEDDGADDAEMILRLPAAESPTLRLHYVARPDRDGSFREPLPLALCTWYCGDSPPPQRDRAFVCAQSAFAVPLRGLDE